MPTNRKRVISQTLLAATLLLTGPALAACGGSSSGAKPGAAGSVTPSAANFFDQALAYSRCMRDNGVPDFPDPQQNNGRVQLNAGTGDTNSEAFQKASEACRDKMPQGQGNGPGGGTVDAAKLAEWVKCLRANGEPKFPDPVVNGGDITITIGDSGIVPSDAAFQKAMSACQSKFPGGALRFEK